ncbi:hypothetical protein J2W17_002938 [Pseudomonas lini]|uniref:hypothetical protein n=1 Tax=Pseudomonas lini TaxID=163011 RepID=UPI00277DE93D|nr:hypothetical protein [Pseudomonas lini]MDQ0123990.1 hypothetical protein [Pseudomonas lini]
MNTLPYDYRKPSTVENLKFDIDTLTISNKAEKQSIIDALKTELSPLPDPNIEFKLSHFLCAATHESSLKLALRAGQSKLNDLLNSEEFRSLNDLSSLPDTALYVCDSNKNMEVFVADTSIHIDDLLKDNEILSRHLDELGEYAGRAGGFIYNSDDFNVEQWLRFYEYPIPSSAKQLANLIAFLSKEHPGLSGTGHYNEILKNPENYPTALSLAQREEIQKVTKTFGASGRGQLLNRLFEQIVVATVDSFRIAPHQCVTVLLESPIGKIWAKGYLAALGWYGTRSDEAPSQDDLNQLLMAAIVLNIDPSMGADGSTGRVLDYELYDPVNGECHPTQVLRRLEQHLVDSKNIDSRVAPLAAYILTADTAPEYVVKNIPENMTISSPAWLLHSFTVAKIEIISPGASRAMTYEQVQSYAELEPFNDELEQLFGLTVITQILNWGAVNRLITPNAAGEYTADDLSKAESRYAEYTEALEQCSNAMNTAYPTRNEVALKELIRVMPEGDYLTEKKHIHNDLPLDKTISIHELFMSGDLQDGSGNRLSFFVDSHEAPQVLEQIKPYISRLRNAQELYKETFSHFYQQLQLATATALKLALSKMPEKDRNRLAYGTLSFYTVRKKFSDHATQETQRQRDKYRGRYGVIICSKYESKRYYYELFTLRAECERREDLRNVFEKTAIEYFDPTEDADKDQKQWQTQAIEWPLDINAYVNGTKPDKNASHKLVVEKLWESSESESRSPTAISGLQMFFSEKTNDTVNKLLAYFPPTKYEELYDIGFGMTATEAARKNRKDNQELILNLVIPFKACIEDLTSGDPGRKAAGAFGCALDALAVVGAVAGVASKFASAAFKTGSFLTKTIRLLRVTGKFALSLVNPLDGVPSLLKKGGKLTEKGVLLITRQGAKTSHKAARQLRALNGTFDLYRAAKSLNCVDMKLARLKGIGELSQATDVLILRRGNDWFQLKLNACEARGGKITRYKDMTGSGALEQL